MGRRGAMKHTLHRHAGWRRAIPKFCRYTTGMFTHLAVSLVNALQENELDMWLQHKMEANTSNVTRKNTCNRGDLGI